MRAHGPRWKQGRFLSACWLAAALFTALPFKAWAQCQGGEVAQLPFGARQVSCNRDSAMRTVAISSQREGATLAGARIERPGERGNRPEFLNESQRPQELAQMESARRSAIDRFSTGSNSQEEANGSLPSNKGLDGVPWADSHDWIHNPPQILKELKNYRRQGVPIIRLVNSAQTVVAFGISNHGKPGLYFTRKLPF